MTGLGMLLACVLCAPLAPGNHVRTLSVDGAHRTYLVYVPAKVEAGGPRPVVLLFHGAGMNASAMARFCGMNAKADEAGFIAVYPNGTGVGGLMLTWNAGGFKGRLAGGRPDDVKFVVRLLDELEAQIPVDRRRIYAAGMSNGGMFCYRLAAELSGRIAAIAPVAGTMAIERAAPARPVPLMHFHGTADRIVPYEGPRGGVVPAFVTFKSVDETIAAWVALNRCRGDAEVEQLPDAAQDGTTVTRSTYRPQERGAEVILVRIEGGGHTWPGMQAGQGFLGASTRDIAANDMIWDFFARHRLPALEPGADRKAQPEEAPEPGPDEKPESGPDRKPTPEPAPEPECPPQPEPAPRPDPGARGVE